MPRQTNKNIPTDQSDNQYNNDGLVRIPKKVNTSRPQQSRGRRSTPNSSNKTQRSFDTPSFISSPAAHQNIRDITSETTDLSNTKTSKTPFSKSKKKTKIKPQKTIKQKQKKSKTSKENKDGGLFQRIKFFLQTHGIGEMLQIFCEWFDDKYYTSIAIAVLGIIIGMLFNRYISIGFAFALVLFGILLSRKELSKGEYSCYISGAIVFIVPYLF